MERLLYKAIGTTLDPLSGLTVLPGTPVGFNIRIQPDPNASIGFQQMTIRITSSQYPDVYTLLPVQFLVKADRIPVITPTRSTQLPSFAHLHL